jgi:hypothetical protein
MGVACPLFSLSNQQITSLDLMSVLAWPCFLICMHVPGALAQMTISALEQISKHGSLPAKMSIKTASEQFFRAESHLTAR